MTREDPQLKVRLTPDLKQRIAEAAVANGRSLNAEIVARLELTFEHLGEYNIIGANALSKRLEASIEAAQHFAFSLLYELRAAGGGVGDLDRAIGQAVEEFGIEHGMNKGHAVQTILRDWLVEHGRLDPGSGTAG